MQTSVARQVTLADCIGKGRYGEVWLGDFQVRFSGNDLNVHDIIYEFIRRQLGCDRTYNHTSLEIGIKEEEKKMYIMYIA